MLHYNIQILITFKMKHGITFMKISTFYCKICNEDLQVKLSTEELQGFRLVKMWNYS